MYKIEPILQLKIYEYSPTYNNSPILSKHTVQLRDFLSDYVMSYLVVLLSVKTNF